MQEITDTASPSADPASTAESAAPGKGRQRLYRRFGKAERIGHIGLGISFIGLAITGLPLLYSQEPWARWVAHSMGGFEATGFLHRFFALVMIVLFA